MLFSDVIVGRQASNSLRADLACDALEMAVSNRRRRSPGLPSAIRRQGAIA
jgi:transposase InsO family protein